LHYEIKIRIDWFKIRKRFLALTFHENSLLNLSFIVNSYLLKYVNREVDFQSNLQVLRVCINRTFFPNLRIAFLVILASFQRFPSYYILNNHYFYFFYALSLGLI